MFTLPPKDSTLSLADWDTLCNEITIFFVKFPPPKSLIFFLPDIKPALCNESKLMSEDSVNCSISDKLTISYFSLNLELLKPFFFGRRRYNGVWPPSKPDLLEYPDLDFWPLWPLPHSPPEPEALPRPFLFLFFFIIS